MLLEGRSRNINSLLQKPKGTKVVPFWKKNIQITWRFTSPLKLLIFLFLRTFVSRPWKKRILKQNWSKLLLTGTTRSSHLVTSRTGVSYSWEVTLLVRLSPLWKILWWFSAHWWATGKPFRSSFEFHVSLALSSDKVYCWLYTSVMTKWLLESHP